MLNNNNTEDNSVIKANKQFENSHNFVMKELGRVAIKSKGHK